ncbi:MAG: hypothetical protein ACOWWO_06095 [Peptococcaceae bacterium]
MGMFNDKLAQKRICKAQKDFENLQKPTQHFNKLDLVKSFQR